MHHVNEADKLGETGMDQLGLSLSQMDTIFRVLFLHMRTLWRRARGLFVSIWFQRLQTSGSQKNAPATRIHRPPTPIPPSPSGAASRIAPKISMARTKVWACLRARKLKAQMRERRVAKKQAMYARIAARVTAVAVGKGKEGTKGEDEEEDEEEEVQEEDGHFDAHLPSAPRVDTCRLPSPLSLPHWGVSSTFGLELQLELGYDFPSPTDSCASSSGSTTTAPRTPVTPMTPTTTPLIPRNSIHFPGTRECMATESPRMPATLRANHVRRDPRARGRFRTLSASITARSPLSLSFPISFSLPLAARRASSPNVTLQRYMMDGTAYREGVDGREGEDPFGTHGSGYYAPGEWTALGHGDAYDLSAWAWACDRSPHRRAKKRMRAATVGSASVYRAPVHAASAPQLTYAQHTDGQLEHSRRLANASAGVAGEKISRVVRMPMPANTSTHENETATGSRRGMRSLILPQKLGLLTIGAASGSGRKPEYGAERAEWEIKASGWDVDLERGVCRGQEVAGT
ncbi:hypothetical protein EDB89DRAFT_1901777 [Lactarius sanguifluus]|nr:hypothetical protein EDB89DRAFT_1901777 [Lactarius sanguifluus]